MNRPPKSPAWGLMVASAATTRAVPPDTSSIGTLCSTIGPGILKPGIFDGIVFDISLRGASRVCVGLGGVEAAGIASGFSPDSMFPDGADFSCIDAPGGNAKPSDFLLLEIVTAAPTTTAVATPPNIP